MKQRTKKLVSMLIVGTDEDKGGTGDYHEFSRKRR